MKNFNKLLHLMGLLLFFVYYNTNTQENSQDFFQEPCTRWEKSNWKNHGVFNCGIEFLRDNRGKNFVLKHQSNRESTIHEIIGARIGSSIDNVVNKVIVAPTTLPSKKKFSYGTSTLHTMAAGIEVGKIRKYQDNLIEDGLSCEWNLKNITKDTTLAKIVAVNVYLNDDDSHNNNLFFDRNTNKYCSIDKARSFQPIRKLCNYSYEPNNTNHDWYQNYKLQYIFPNCLATQAHDFLSTLQEEDLDLHTTEALTVVHNTLETLLDEQPADKIHTEWMAVAKDINFDYCEEKKEDIRIALEYNCHEVKQVCKELKRLTKNRPAPFSASYVSQSMINPSRQAQEEFLKVIYS